MASWGLFAAPWISAGRSRFRWGSLARTPRLQKNSLIASNSVSQRDSEKIQSYPHSRPGSSVFEDVSDEYAAITRESSARAKSPPEKLEHLVAEGKFEEADRVRTELIGMGVELKEDTIYEEAAVNVLRLPNPQDHTETFSNWLSLLPPAHHSSPRSFHNILNSLFKSPIANMHLIMVFGLICASKGYLDVVRERIVPVLARYGDKTTTEEWLRVYEAESAQYLKTFGVHQPKPDLAENRKDFVFEALDDEYNSIVSETPLSQSPRSSNAALMRLVNEGEYDLAERVRLELLETGIPIQPSEVYIKALIAVLRRPLLQDRASAFANWFSLLPDANPSPSKLSNIRNSLFSSPSTNMPLIIQFGILCASKGYGDEIASQLIPVVLRFTDPSVSTSFLRQYETEATRWILKQNHSQKEVIRFVKRIREVAIRTYCQAGWLDVAVKLLRNDGGAEPLVVSLFTCNFLLKRLQRKIAKNEQDHINIRLVHDLRNRWYGAPHTVDSYSTEITAQIISADTSERLPHLIKTKQYAEANRLRASLESSGVPIKQNMVYEHAAQAALQHPGIPNKIFFDWFSLVPDAHTSTLKTFSGIRNLLFASPTKNISLIMRFGLLCASKGYADLIHRQVLPVVVRSSTPEDAASYLKEFEDKALQYMQTYYPTREIGHVLKSFHGLAVRIYCLAGRLDDAVRVLRADGKQNIRVSTFTYNLLLDELQAKHPKEVQDHENIKFVRRHRDQIQYSQDYPGLNDTTPLETLYDDARLAAAWTTAQPLPAKQNLTSDLRYFIRFVKRSISAVIPPHPYTLVDFIEQYLETGRTRGLTLLRKKALRSSYRNAGLWVFAEMLYYRHQRLDELVVATFVDHFYLSGVPREEILSHYTRYSASQPDREPLERGKIWPSPEHIALVWHSMVSLTRGPLALERLYPKLLNSTRESTTPAPLRPIISSSGEEAETAFSPLPRPPIQLNPDPACFTPFIRMFSFRSGPNRGAAVLNDMVKLGLTPNVYHFTVLAGEYAARSDVRRALLILDRMERTQENADTDILGTNADLPTPNIVIYTSLMRGFCNARCLEGAEEVERRIKEKLGYRLGMNPYTDLAHSMLQDLRQQVALETNFRRSDRTADHNGHTDLQLQDADSRSR